MSRAKPVFLSYARQTAGPAARALHQELGNELCFIDTEDIEVADRFPQRLSEALLSAKLVVAFVDRVYFKRWYCLREWMLALAPWRSAIECGLENPDSALAHLVIVVASDPAEEDLARLPPQAQRTNWLTAADTRKVAEHVRRTLRTTRATVRRQFETFHVPPTSRDFLTSDAVLPLQPRRLTVPQNLENVDTSLGTRFIGRANDLWRLHDLLSTERHGGDETEPLTCAVQGMGGGGKTRLAIEYARRFGPAQYRGGVFWIKAPDPRTLVRQFRSILVALGVDNVGRDEDEVRERLGHALIGKAASAPVLYVVDDLPEAEPGGMVLPLRHYCPAIGHVSCLITTRVDQGYGHSVRTLPLDVLDPVEARALLYQDVTADVVQALSEREWDEVVKWAGRLPLALEVLNGMLRTGALTADMLLVQGRGREIAKALSDHVAQLRRSLPADRVRGAEIFELSYSRLDQRSQGLSNYIAWLAPAPVPLLFTRVAANVQHIVDAAIALLVTRSLLKRVGVRQEAIEMHPVLASHIRVTHGSPTEEKAVLFSLAQRFAELPGGERDAEIREHLLDMLDHLRWQASRFPTLPGEPPDERERSVLLDALPSLHGLLNSTDLDTPALAVLELCELIERSHEGPLPELVTAYLHLHRGAALLRLAQWDTRATRLQQAREFTEKAIEIYRGDAQQTMHWAQGQDNLGMILLTLGRHAHDSSEQRRLFGAFESAFRSALQVYKRDEERVDWARTQNHIGNALSRRAGVEESPDSRIDLMTAAADAHSHALEAYSREEEPDSWAVTLTNRANVLVQLGQDAALPDCLNWAVEDFEASLEVYTKERRPLRWARVQHNVALALDSLAAHKTGTGRRRMLSDAAAAERRAIEVFTKEEQPLLCATAHLGLGLLLAKQAASQRAPQRVLKDAAAAFRASLEIFTDAEHPREYESATTGLQAVLAASRPRRKTRRSRR